MTPLQRIEIKRSEIRQELVKLAENDQPSEADQERVRKLTQELGDSESSYQAALASQEARIPDDAQGRDFVALENRADSEPWMVNLVSMQPRTGVALEYAQEKGFKETEIPTRFLRGIDQRRGEYVAHADVRSPRPADGTYVSTAPHLGTTFLPSAMMSLGLMPESVGAGERAYPVVSSGLSADMLEQDTAAMAAAVAWQVETLKPKEGVCRFTFDSVDELVYPELEGALREECSGALDELMSQQVVAGSGASGQVSGLQNQIAPATIPTSVADFNAFRQLSVDAVDSRYAASEMDINLLVGLATWKLASTTDKSAESDETGSTYLSRMCNRYTLSAHVPAPPDQGDSEDVQRAYITKNRNLSRSYALPMWETMSIEVDRASSSALRRINVTAAVRWNFDVLRAGNFASPSIKVA